MLKTATLALTASLAAFSPAYADTLESGKTYDIELREPSLTVHVQKEKEQVAGELPCNRFTSTVTENNGVVRFTNTSTTRKLCEPQLMKAERLILQRLEKDEFVIRGNKLLVK